MTLASVLSIILISLGAIVMFISILKYRATIRLAQSFHERGRAVAIRWYKIHHLLMLFFLIGYVVVLYSVVKEIEITGVIFTSLIFFFGAGFVLIGILLQTSMLRSIRKKHEKMLLKNEQLGQVENATIYALAYLAEIRDWETGKHIERTSQYVKLLAEDLSVLPPYNDYLTPRYVEAIVKSAPLHDIGKVGIPDDILKKTDKLTLEEFDTIKQHCEYGANVLSLAENKLSFESYLALAIPLVRSHHEKWDGSGYPEGLKADSIPLSAQIMAVADVYDALRSDRCYKKGFSHEKSKEIIEADKGTHFAPDVVDAFIRLEQTFMQISTESSG